VNILKIVIFASIINKDFGESDGEPQYFATPVQLADSRRGDKMTLVSLVSWG
jgi:hypothetical protein